MKYALSLLSLFLVPSGLAHAQGVSAPWDTSKDIASLMEQAERLNPLLEQLTPQQWEAQGAPATYTTQWRLARSEVGYLMGAAQALRRQPEKLTLALEALFRLQAVEAQVNSLVDGVRRYQNPAVAELLVSVLGANATNRDQLRQYVSDLAQTKEQEFQIVDREAQRCRGSLVQPPARPAAPKPAPAK
ncbi:MAG: hypothetical protein EXQ47_11985 [Bryobacterales bacterium]|nr:hypothetical protein [Bryobacterales bacterium]